VLCERMPEIGAIRCGEVHRGRHYPRGRMVPSS
jgi:hypothetical protein